MLVLCFLAIPLSLICLGCILLYAERKLISKGFRSYFWPHTKGVVKDMRHDSYIVTGLIGLSGTGIGPIRQTDVLYLYQYHVAGKEYQTEDYCFGARGEMRRATYMIGQHVPVYYNPNNPAEAVIERGLKATALIGLLPLSLGLGGLLVFEYLQ